MNCLVFNLIKEWQEFKLVDYLVFCNAKRFKPFYRFLPMTKKARLRKIMLYLKSKRIIKKFQFLKFKIHFKSRTKRCLQVRLALKADNLAFKQILELVLNLEKKNHMARTPLIKIKIIRNSLIVIIYIMVCLLFLLLALLFDVQLILKICLLF